MATKSKLTSTKVRSLVKINYSPKTKVDWLGEEITIKRNLSFSEMLSFINNVCGCCFSESDNEYKPEYKDMLIKSNMIDFYTNIPNSSKVSERYDLVYHSNIIDCIKSNFDAEQFDEIKKAIDEKLSYMVSTNVESVAEKFSNTLNEYMSEVINDNSNMDIDTMIKALQSIKENGEVDKNDIVRSLL